MLFNLSCTAAGSVTEDAPVVLLKAQEHLCWNLSKNSSRSGTSVGVGENLSPSSSALIWQSLSRWEERFKMALDLMGWMQVAAGAALWWVLVVDGEMAA